MQLYKAVVQMQMHIVNTCITVTVQVSQGRWNEAGWPKPLAEAVPECTRVVLYCQEVSRGLVWHPERFHISRLT